MVTSPSKRRDIGTGIAFGLPAGVLIGIIFLNGNIALGLAIGLIAAVVYGSVPDVESQKRVYPLVGVFAGAVAGSLLGLLLGLLHGQYAAAMQQDYTRVLFGLPYKDGYMLFCSVIAAAMGLLAGAALANRK